MRRLAVGRGRHGWPHGVRAMVDGWRCDVLLLNVTVRGRSLLRDLAYGRVVSRPYVIHLHGMDPDVAERASRRAVVRRWFCEARRVVSLTDQQDDWLRDLGVSEGRVVRGVACYDPNVVATGLERTSTRPGLLFIGRLEPGKGLRRLLDALASLGPTAPPVTIAGTGSLGRSLKRDAARLGLAASFPGWVDGEAKRRLLAQATVGVLFSDDEACPVFALEALASGCVMVASDAGALPELVGEHGVVLARGAPVEALAAAIRRTCEHATQVPSSWTRRFHPARVGARLGDLLREAADGAP